VESKHINYFERVYENSLDKTIQIVIGMVLLIPAIILSAGVIWYSDNAPRAKQTVLNKIASYANIYGLEFIFIIYLPNILRLVVGPFSVHLCTFNTVMRMSILNQIGFMFGAQATFRYLFIFYLKNPGINFTKKFFIFFFLNTKKIDH